MKPSLAPGLVKTRSFVVDERRTIGFMGSEGRVYATPEMVRDVEMTCRDLLLEHLDAGEDSVGIRVELDHLAATPLGLAVEIAVRVAELKGRQVVFEVEARDPIDEIARGRHVRFVVEVAKTKERLAAKRAKAGLG
jgi:fluoroacetyl-CoA thioesterase